ncbi:phosphoribosylformylglycinamidine synthase I [Thermaerobacter composti]|uniref:Phosphoribosylformylglycinamidine synthase subunit PurQ n=1 Tax=Thermaerobacter composti TaxID=554949 RepID=A0ABZ0QL09_9FIRM|nr:phosphoribosylformylglycinamidine synthase I [Thermaerobacter composti]WPD18194.1 phosphoribosylformylglycinamidine synthase I [Thermaerobacter composti]
MRLAVVRFPGSNCEVDVATVLARDLGRRVEIVDHRRRDLRAFAGVVLPGGFAFGDYLRPGALAARTPVMEAVRAFAAAGGPVLGICNGFQILCEAGLLPGALRPNRQLRFQCRPVWVRIEGPSALTAGLPPGRVVRLEIAHGEGAYVGEEPDGRLVPGRGARVILRYVDGAGRPVPAANPNGSVANIAGICNATGNVVGLMPHPERRPAEAPGGAAGRPARTRRAGGGPAEGDGPASRSAVAGSGACDGLALLAAWAEQAEVWWTLRRSARAAEPRRSGRAAGARCSGRVEGLQWSGREAGGRRSDRAAGGRAPARPQGRSAPTGAAPRVPSGPPLPPRALDGPGGDGRGRGRREGGGDRGR